ncbi:type II toxin-antitoxin system Phd/YefM family antitoxin [Nocardiopsis sp. JB363]|uniref:type II toxin-antitoxin system Phd/YefM family antitoxin n=1 Tax=Nocardiopsis sp. JB363 TaxID=1434837 RepID=UPI00190E734E|nr:type II toxin-antitoxin system Phd/YefM family antitoxin [Nocardiopsis sp. JB363]
MIKELDVMANMGAGDVRENFSDTLNRVSYGHERVTITRRGRAVAALISAEDLELLEALEDARDAAELEAAIAEDDGERIPLDQVERESTS